MPEQFLIAQDLHKSYKDLKAVDGVSFSIEKGEIFGLLGPNGAGKSTTIRILSTIIPSDQGEVVIGGYSLKDNADKVRGIIGTCPQELALYAEMPAFDNLLFFGRMAGMGTKEAREQAMDNLELIGLEDRARKGKVADFSG